MKIKDPIEKTLELGTFVFFMSLIAIVLFQIITRFFLPDFSKIWTEEASRLFFIYAVAFAAPFAMKKKEFVNVDIIVKIVPKPVGIVLEVFGYLITIILFVVLLINALAFAKLGVNQLSATMDIPMSVAYSSIFTTAVFILFYAIVNLIGYIGNIKKGSES